MFKLDHATQTTTIETLFKDTLHELVLEHTAMTKDDLRGVKKDELVDIVKCVHAGMRQQEEERRAEAAAIKAATIANEKEDPNLTGCLLKYCEGLKYHINNAKETANKVQEKLKEGSKFSEALRWYGEEALFAEEVVNHLVAEHDYVHRQLCERTETIATIKDTLKEENEDRTERVFRFSFNNQGGVNGLLEIAEIQALQKVTKLLRQCHKVFADSLNDTPDTIYDWHYKSCRS